MFVGAASVASASGSFPNSQINSSIAIYGSLHTILTTLGNRLTA